MWAPRAAATLAVAGCAACIVGFGLADHSNLLSPLTLTLLAIVLVARLAVIRWSGSLVISGSFIGSMLAVAFLGPAAALAIEWIGELWTFGIERYRRRVLAVNLFAVGAPVLLGGFVTQSLDSGSPWFYLALAAVSASAMLLNLLIVAVVGGALDGEPLGDFISAFAQMGPATAINVGLVVATAGMYEKLGLGGALFA